MIKVDSWLGTTTAGCIEALSSVQLYSAKLRARPSNDAPLLSFFYLAVQSRNNSLQNERGLPTVMGFESTAKKGKKGRHRRGRHRQEGKKESGMS